MKGFGLQEPILILTGFLASSMTGNLFGPALKLSLLFLLHGL